MTPIGKRVAGFVANVAGQIVGVAIVALLVGMGAIWFFGGESVETMKKPSP